MIYCTKLIIDHKIWNIINKCVREEEQRIRTGSASRAKCAVSGLRVTFYMTASGGAAGLGTRIGCTGIRSAVPAGIKKENKKKWW